MGEKVPGEDYLIQKTITLLTLTIPIMIALRYSVIGTFFHVLSILHLFRNLALQHRYVDIIGDAYPILFALFCP